MKQVLYCLFFISFMAQAQDYGHQCVQIKELLTAGNLENTFQELQKIRSEPNFAASPKWFQAFLTYQIARTHLLENKHVLCYQTLEQAVQLGFDDYLAFFEEPAWKKVSAQTDFQKSYTKIKISSLDSQELLWLKQEINNINHDTSMMIIENLNRKDPDPTPVFKSQIPARFTTSVAVQTYRAIILSAQTNQKIMVTLSDNSRRNHLISMNMMDFSSGGTTQFDIQMSILKKQEIQQSREDAIKRGNSRKQAIWNRQFRPSTGASAQPQSCPPLTNNQLNQWAGQYQKQLLEVRKLRKKVKGKGAQLTPPSPHNTDPNFNPLRNAKPGDTTHYFHVVSANNQKQYQKVTYNILAKKGNQLSYQETYSSEQNGETKNTTTIIIQPTLKEQLLYELGKNGKVELVSYQTKKGGYSYKGSFPPVHIVEMQFYWTLNNQRILWQGSYSISSSIPGAGYYGVTLKNAQFSIQIDLDSYSRGFANLEKKQPTENNNSTWKTFTGTKYRLQLPQECIASPIQFLGGQGTLYAHKRLMTEKDDAAIRFIVVPFFRTDWANASSDEVGQFYATWMTQQNKALTLVGKDRVQVGNEILLRYKLTGIVSGVSATFWLIAPKKGAQGCALVFMGGSAQMNAARSILGKVLNSFQLEN